MENNQKTEELAPNDEATKCLLDRPYISENLIREELEKDGILPSNGCSRKSGLSYYLSITGSQNKKTFPRRPPRILEKISSYRNQNENKEAKERMIAAETQHKEYLKAKGESARVFEERLARLKEKREKEEMAKRKRIKEKMERAEKIRKSREKCLPSAMARIMRVQERRELQQKKMLEKFEQKWERDNEKRQLSLEKNINSSSFQTIKQRLDTIEREINPVELLLRNDDHPPFQYSYSPHVSP